MYIFNIYTHIYIYIYTYTIEYGYLSKKGVPQLGATWLQLAPGRDATSWETEWGNLPGLRKLIFFAGKNAGNLHVGYLALNSRLEFTRILLLSGYLSVMNLIIKPVDNQ